MPKNRMTALDVRAMVTDIAPVVTRLRVANVYDISSKVYVLKLSEGEIKRHLVLEAGTRFHLSAWKRDKNAIPSVFTMRLRKFLRTKRVASISQLGFDRVIDIQFGYNENANHLLIEFYSRGNVVLTDSEYQVKATWRQFKADDTLAVRLNSTYPHEEYRKDTKMYRMGLDAIVHQDEGVVEAFVNTYVAEYKALDNLTRQRKKAAAPPDTILLYDVIAYCCPVAHRELIEAVIDGHEAYFQKDAVPIKQICSILYKLLEIFQSVSVKGQLGAHDNADVEKLDGIPGYTRSSPTGVNDDFNPIKDLTTASKLDWPVRTFSRFHECVDNFYTTSELDRATKLVDDRAHEMESKVEKITKDQNERVRKLKEEKIQAEKQAQSVEIHIDKVTKVLEMMSRVMSTGTSWDVIENMVREQRRQGHPIASYIQELKLKKNMLTYLLPDASIMGEQDIDDENELEEDIPLIPVDLVISDLAYPNAQRLYAQRRAAQLKYEKTKEAAERAIEQAEAAVAKDRVKKEAALEPRPAIQKLRKIFWFEKFHWFVSSDKYLIIAGRDAIQNEILYKKYLRKHDLYVHADVHGAASCIIRNTGDGEVPKMTIEEAGIMSVCRSNAWKEKILATAYWVYAYQVSKTPQPGEYVSTGGFIIRGKRNPIVIKKLEVGVGILFHLGDQESIRRHIQEDESGEELKENEHIKANDEEEQESDEQDLVPDPREQEIVAAKDYDDSSLEEADNVSGSGCKVSPRVQFGSMEILPSVAIEPKVEFEELPPAVYHVHSEHSILSDDAFSDGTPSEQATPGNIPNHMKTLRRPDSVDELPPPEEYLGRAAAADLLSHRTPETEEVYSPINWVPATTVVRHNDQLNSRQYTVDGGPLPRGFVASELPPVREVLKGRMRSRSELSELGEKRVDELAPSTPQKSGKARISKAQRRQYKRSHAEPATESPIQGLIDTPVKSAKSEATPPVRMTATKARKLKKIREKYGEQSDEERDLAMKLMGSRPPPVQVKDSEAAPNPVWAAPKKFVVPDRKIEDEESDVEDSELTSRYEVVHELTGRPHPKDVLMFALPVCAPYSAIQRYSYKGKLLPGGSKKGQAVNLIMRAFIDLTPVGSLHRRLLKNIAVDEVSAAIVASPVVKIQGVDKIKKEEAKIKKAKKVQKKQQALKSANE